MANDGRHTRRYDRRTRLVTAVCFLAAIAVLVYLYLHSGGSYLPAWVTMLLAALLILASLSIPRFIRISPSSVEIHCTVELTVVPLDDIISIRLMEQKEMKWAVPVPLLGMYAVFGYYGYYVNLRKFRVFKVYSKQWNNFIMIENIYEDIIVVSADAPEQFIAETVRNMNPGLSADDTPEDMPEAAS